jgi:hypothetical protein
MEYFPQGKADTAGLDTAGGYLVEQWLELVIIVPVQQNYLEVPGRKFARQSQPAKASANDHYTFLTGRTGRKFDTHNQGVYSNQK